MPFHSKNWPQQPRAGLSMSHPFILCYPNPISRNSVPQVTPLLNIKCYLKGTCVCLWSAWAEEHLAILPHRKKETEVERERKLCPCPESHSRWAVNCPTVSSPRCPSWDRQSLSCRPDQGSVKVTLPTEMKVEVCMTTPGLASQRTIVGDLNHGYVLLWCPEARGLKRCWHSGYFQEESVPCLSHSVLASDHLLWLADVWLWYLTFCALECCSLPWLYLNLPFEWARQEH